jgi:hypothetical protein
MFEGKARFDSKTELMNRGWKPLPQLFLSSFYVLAYIQKNLWERHLAAIV